MKKINIFSFGYLFPEFIPLPPQDENTTQIIIDVREMVAEIWDKQPPSSGLVKAIREQIIANFDKNGHLTLLKYQLSSLLQELIAKDCGNKDAELKIYFGCKGGWQRSVSLAIFSEEFLKTLLLCYDRDIRKEITVNISHLTMYKWIKD